ncbi:hypothetical protein AYO20_09366 [Fonsecaea nubica]|uniref:Uncharacterized protein n=1 Tax=Fonsecaea nubica TaxID=856822 RepID=A0A178CI18_9EURO|nr:hypothetical protein AYO20_09366 [Fonsecaea nubica]OAL28886.1 hypothetical protein AYO20_09366 [Fonsecaea nubica]
MTSKNFDARSVHSQPEQVEDADNNSATTLKFCSSAEASFPDRAAHLAPSVRHVALPVANTIFVNERRTTLFQDSWRMKLTESEEPTISYLGRKSLKSFQMNLPCPGDCFVDGGSAPLHALTKPRKVVRSMGNVLRQIEVDGEAVPASQELETAVSAYIKSNPTSMVRGPLLVFGLIRSPGTPSFDADADANKDTKESGSLKPLWQGAQLFKVSGGGGGWGKRQGLLSLESAVDFEIGDAPSLVFPDLDSDQGGFHELGSRSIVPVDSTVEFLVCSVDSAPKASARTFPSKPALFPRQKDGTTVVLGTAMDPDSQDYLAEDPDTTSTGVVFLPDYFGIVSYGGAALGTDSSISTGHKSKAISRTRCDVPNARFIIRGVGSVQRPCSTGDEYVLKKE